MIGYAGDREMFLAAGMDGYIAKPVEVDALTAVIGRVMAQSREEGEEP